MMNEIHLVFQTPYSMASYPSGLRGRSAKPLFAGSNPADAFFVFWRERIFNDKMLFKKNYSIIDNDSYIFSWNAVSKIYL